ncbi:hypothetical protein BC827DRAFT_1212625 [Russula dissimulans]|nr:hypothetical protein BC827DRAFT_1212625 [Russula dissimulans]
MHFIDIFTLSLSILGVHDLILYLRFLLPRNLIHRVAGPLTEAQQVLHHAQSIGAIPHASKYVATLATFENGFLRMRVESHRSPAIFQQLFCAIWSGLTYRLYALSLRIDAIKVKLELAVDEQQLASIITSQCATTAALLDPAAATAIPMNVVAEPLHVQPDATP